MKTASIFHELTYKDSKVAITVLIDTDFTKEIRIAMRKGQVMKEHKTSYPIVVEIFDGKLDFGVNGEVLNLERGDLIALDGSVPHDLTAVEDCIVRLTLSKSDTAERVKKVVE